MSTTTYRPLTCDQCGTTENISYAAGVARILCPDCYQTAKQQGELDALVEDIATRVYGPLDPDDGYGWLDPIYAWVEPLLANGVAPNAADLATAWQFLCEQDADAYDRNAE